MYQNFFGLSKSPFEARADAQFFYATPVHEELLAALQYELSSGGGSALVVGEAGIGKTQLVRQLVLSMQPADRVVVITWPPNGQINVLREVCKGFGLDIPSAYSEAKGLARLRRQLINIDKTKGCAIVIVDQAENLCADAMMQVAMMAGLGQQESTQLRLVLVGQPRVTSMLNRPEFSQLKQQLFPPRQLPALNIDETKAYLDHRLHVSGASEVDIFGADAVEVIHSISSGVPRLINKIADAAMMAAYGAQLKHVSYDLIRELDFPASAMDVDGAPVQRPGRKSVRGVVMQQSKEFFGASSAYAGGAGQGNLNLSSVATSQSFADKPEAIDRLERVLARAERMQATLEASTAQRLAVEKHLTSLTEGADSLSGNLAQAVERANHSIEQIEERVAHLFATSQRRIKSDELHVQQIVEASSETAQQVAQAERVCERTEELESRLACFAEQVADKADEVQRHVSELIGGVATSEKTLELLTSMASKQHESFETQSATIKKTMDSAQSMADEARRLHQESFKDLEDHRLKIKDYNEAAQALVDSVEHQRRVIDRSVERTGRNLAEINGRFAQVDMLQSKVSDGLAEFGALAQRVDDATKSADRVVERSVKELGNVENNARQLEQHVSKLEHRVMAASENLSRFQSESTGSLEHALRIQTTLDKSLTEGRALSQTLSGGEGRMLALQRQATAILSNAELSLKNLEESRAIVDHGDQTLAELSSVVAAVEDQKNHFNEHVETAALIEKNAVTMLAGVSEKIAQLDSHQAKATNVLNRLSSANIDSEKLLSQNTKQVANVESIVAVASADAAKSKDEIERLVQDVWSLTTKTEAVSQTLDAKNLEAKRLTNKLALAIAPANKLAHAIEQKVQKATEDVEAISCKTQDASELLKQLKTAGNGLENAKKAAQVIGETLTQAKDVQETLNRAVQTADQRAALLSTAGEDVAGMLDQHEQLQLSSETTLNLLVEAISTSEGSSEVAERLMIDFLKQSADIGRKLELMAKQSADLEQRMADQIHKPMELISTARAQAAQLEQVCGAVRKVFAGLSKASLDAQRQIRGVDAIGQTTAKRLQQQIRGVDAVGQTTAKRLEGLISDSEAAGQIMKEWVSEAVRVQARLQDSIEQAPSIRETHAGAELERISKRIDSVGAAKAMTTTIDLEGKTKTFPTARKQSLDDRIANPSTRSQQVARLIEEAKQGAVEAGLRA